LDPFGKGNWPEDQDLIIPAYRSVPLLIIRIKAMLEMSPRIEFEVKVLRSVLLILIGIFAMISGEFDDSPGLQGLGLILIISVSYLHFRNRRTK
jgi:hypothetical protein